MTDAPIKSYKVWDRTTRIFHWINVLAVIILLIIGTIIFNGKMFGLTGDGKVMMKTVHVYVGYVFVLNLSWRLIWGFIGGPYARWGAILPKFGKQLSDYRGSLKAGKPQAYAGLNPLGRFAVSLLLLALTVQAVTGLVIAGTDIYFPPFGFMITEWVAAAGLDPATLVPGDKSMVDADAYKEMRAFRKPYIQTHVATYYALLGLIFMHVFMVILTEVKYGGSMISAMFTGKKMLKDKPVDMD